MVHQAEDQCGRLRGDRGHRRARRARPSSYRGGIVVVSCGAANSAKLLLHVGQRPASARAGQRVGSGRAELHVPQQPWRCWPSRKEPNPTKYQKTLGLNDFYFGMDGLRVPDGQHPDGRQVARADVPGREADRGRARAACGRWRCSPSTPSTSGSRPKTCPGRTTASRVDRDGNITAELHAQQPGAQAEALREAQVDAEPPRHARAPDPAQSVHEERDRHRRRGAPGRYLPLRDRSRRPRCSTRTAKPTSSTTCTWSTPASSPASAR